MTSPALPDAQPRITHPFADPPAEGAATEVAEGILWMRLPLPMKLDHVNVYALDDGDGWTIVDTGMATRRSRAIWQALLDGPLAGRPVQRVIVTHHHPDHVGLAGWFMQDHGAKLLMTRTAWLLARMLQLDEQDRPCPQTVQHWRRAGMRPDVLAKRMQERPFNFADVVAPLPLGFTRLSEGQAVDMGGRRWVVRLGHGHAPDHATFWCEDEPLVLSGDQIIHGISSNLGVYATEPMADPVAEWLESCERLATHATADQLVLPGHKLPFRGLDMRLTQLIQNHHSALARLQAGLAQPKAAGDVFDLLFNRPIGEGEYGLALVEAIAHLNHLHLAGQARRGLRADGAHVFCTDPAWDATA